MIELKQIGNGPESLLEVGHFFECVTQFNHRGLTEHAVGVHDKFPMLKRVEVTGDEE